jgi:hypothetical protein
MGTGAVVVNNGGFIISELETAKWLWMDFVFLHGDYEFYNKLFIKKGLEILMKVTYFYYMVMNVFKVIELKLYRNTFLPISINR